MEKNTEDIEVYMILLKMANFRPSSMLGSSQLSAHLSLQVSSASGLSGSSSSKDLANDRRSSREALLDLVAANTGSFNMVPDSLIIHFISSFDNGNGQIGAIVFRNPVGLRRHTLFEHWIGHQTTRWRPRGQCITADTL